MLTGQPFDDLIALIDQLPGSDERVSQKIHDAWVARGLGLSDGALELIEWLGGWQGNDAPNVRESHICVLVSSYTGCGDKEEAIRFVAETSKGAAPVNLLCVDKGIGLRAIELAPQLPHDTKADWPQQDCMAAVAFGMEATASGGGLLGLTDMAPDNEAQALAVIMGCLDDNPAFENLDTDQGIIGAARDLLSAKGQPGTTLEALRLYGGREIAAAVGSIVAARSRRIPVVVDGWAGLAACMVLEGCKKGATDHVRPASSNGQLQRMLWSRLGKEPIVGLPVATGPGCGIAMSVSVLDACCALLGLRRKR